MLGYCKIHNLGHIQPQEFDCILKFQSRNAAPAYWVENNVWMLQGGEIKVGEQENFLKDASFSHQAWVSPRLSRAVNQTKRSAILKEGILHMCSMWILSLSLSRFLFFPLHSVCFPLWGFYVICKVEDGGIIVKPPLHLPLHPCTCTLNVVLGPPTHRFFC